MLPVTRPAGAGAVGVLPLPVMVNPTCSCPVLSPARTTDEDNKQTPMANLHIFLLPVPDQASDFATVLCRDGTVLRSKRRPVAARSMSSKNEAGRAWRRRLLNKEELTKSGAGSAEMQNAALNGRGGKRSRRPILIVRSGPRAAAISRGSAAGKPASRCGKGDRYREMAGLARRPSRPNRIKASTMRPTISVSSKIVRGR